MFHWNPKILAIAVCAVLLMWSPACKKTEDNVAGPAASGAGLPLLGSWDFENGDSAPWQPNNPDNWRIAEVDGSLVYELTAPGEQGEVRAPTSRALLTQFDVTSFEFTGRMKTDIDTGNPHRDLCVFFHYKDPTHFYYVHFSASSDEAHNIIGLVEGADRVKVNREPAGESRPGLVDREWHTFKITYDAETGEARAFIDDMETPIVTARISAFNHGFVGIGSFDDTGFFDDLSLRGRIYGEGGNNPGSL